MSSVVPIVPFADIYRVAHRPLGMYAHTHGKHDHQNNYPFHFVTPFSLIIRLHIMDIGVSMGS